MRSCRFLSQTWMTSICEVVNSWLSGDEARPATRIMRDHDECPEGTNQECAARGFPMPRTAGQQTAGSPSFGRQQVAQTEGSIPIESKDEDGFVVLARSASCRSKRWTPYCRLRGERITLPIPANAKSWRGDYPWSGMNSNHAAQPYQSKWQVVYE